MKRNIYIAYILSFTFHCWFWMGNWIFYYLRFGDYASVALLDSVAIGMGMLMEIPTGALTDLLGKKKTIMMAFFLRGIGGLLMGTATNFWMLALSLWIFICLGSAFYSGTLEALVYDSLKALGLERSYDHKIGTIRALRLWAMAFCGIIGGLSYSIYPGLPYILDGIMCFVGLYACLFIREPSIDTEKYTLQSFFHQTTLGIKTLFGNQTIKSLSIFLVVSGGMATAIYQVLDDLLAVEYGFTPLGISSLFSVACLLAGASSVLFSRLKIKTDSRILLIAPMVVIGSALAVSQVIGMVVSGGLLMIRVIMEALYENTSSVMLNEQIDSSVRATTLSTLSFLRNLPYAIGGTFIGGLILFAGGAKSFSMWYGLVLIIVTILLGLNMYRSKLFSSSTLT